MTLAPTRDLQSMQQQAADCLAGYAEANLLNHAGLDALIAHLRISGFGRTHGCQTGISRLRASDRGSRRSIAAISVGQIATDKHRMT